MTFAEPRRERVRLTSHRQRQGGRREEDPHPARHRRAPEHFDAIVAHDADVDVLLRYGRIEPEAVRGLVQSAFFTRGPKDLATMAVWVGGSSVGAGEEVLDEVKKAFFGPFRVSAMLDSNGCNTTAATAVAKLAKEIELKGRVVIVGAGAVGLRAAALLAARAARSPSPASRADRFGDAYRRARGLGVAEERGFSDRRAGERRARWRSCSTARRSCSPPGPPASSCCPRSCGRARTRSRCWPTSTPPSRSGSRAPTPTTSSRRTTARGARRAGHRRAEDEGAQGVHPPAVRDQRRDPRRRRVYEVAKELG